MQLTAKDSRKAERGMSAKHARQIREACLAVLEHRRAALHGACSQARAPAPHAGFWPPGYTSAVVPFPVC